MKIERFEDIKAWQKARELVKLIYELTRKATFDRDWGLRDQTRRAAVSIMANIAEGFQRRSDREFVSFMRYASGSVAELQSHLYVALDQDYINQDEFKQAYSWCEETAKLIHAFMGYLKGMSR